MFRLLSVFRDSLCSYGLRVGYTRTNYCTKTTTHIARLPQFLFRIVGAFLSLPGFIQISSVVEAKKV